MSRPQAKPLTEYKYEKGAEAVWVVGSYENETAKKILANAHAGVGSYVILNQGGNKFNPACLVAFRYAGERPVPPHLQEVTDPAKIANYEKQRRERQGQTH